MKERPATSWELELELERNDLSASLIGPQKSSAAERL